MLLDRVVCPGCSLTLQPATPVPEGTAIKCSQCGSVFYATPNAVGLASAQPVVPTPTPTPLQPKPIQETPKNAERPVASPADDDFASFSLPTRAGARSAKPVPTPSPRESLRVAPAPKAPHRPSTPAPKAEPSPHSRLAQLRGRKQGVSMPMLLGLIGGGAAVVGIVIVLLILFGPSGGAKHAGPVSGRSFTELAAERAATRPRETTQRPPRRNQLPDLPTKRDDDESMPKDETPAKTEPPPKSETPANTPPPTTPAAPLPGAAQPKPPAPAPAKDAKPDVPLTAKASFDGWWQDFEAARVEAIKEKKDIFILFNASDWHPASIRFGNDVLSSAEFKDAAGKRFVLVHIDFPKEEAAKGKVQDASRNAALAELFTVRTYPTLVLTDSGGKPYGIQSGYSGAVPTAFLQSLGKFQNDRNKRDALLQAVTNSAGDGKLKAIRAVLDHLQKSGLDEFYPELVAEGGMLAAEHDPVNELGQQEFFFALNWVAKVRRFRKDNPAELENALNELKDWNDNKRFRNPNQGARLSLIAAAIHIQNGDTDPAAKMVEFAVAYKPTDPLVVDRMKLIAAAVQPSFGTGFVIGDGYVLTHSQLVDGLGKLEVILPGMDKPIEAEVVGQDKERDLALIRFALPEGVKLQPLALAPQRALNRGDEIAVVGYTPGEAAAAGPGAVVAAAGPATQGMLPLECKLNPGNNGGPVCDLFGNVAGMIVAKSFSGDTASLAIPAAELDDFVKKHWKEYVPPTPGDQLLKLEEVHKKVSGAVVRVVKMR